MVMKKATNKLIKYNLKNFSNSLREVSLLYIITLYGPFLAVSTF